MFIFGIIFTVGSGYIAADTALTITNYFRSSPASSLNNNWLFVLTIIWPAAAAAIYFVIQAGVVIRVLREKKPLCAFPVSFRLRFVDECLSALHELRKLTPL